MKQVSNPNPIFKKEKKDVDCPPPPKKNLDPNATLKQSIHISNILTCILFESADPGLSSGSYPTNKLSVDLDPSFKNPTRIRPKNLHQDLQPCLRGFTFPLRFKQR